MMNTNRPADGGNDKIVQHGRERAVDVDRKRLDQLGRRRLERAHETNAVARDAGVLREIEQHGNARIDDGVRAVTQTWQPQPIALRRVDRPAGDLFDGFRGPAGGGPLGQAIRNQLHGRLGGAAVFVANREQPGRNGCRLRLTVAGCRNARGGGRGRTRSVIGDADRMASSKRRSPGPGNRPR